LPKKQNTKKPVPLPEAKEKKRRGAKKRFGGELYLGMTSSRYFNFYCESVIRGCDKQK
jgi:hypothetical protein